MFIEIFLASIFNLIKGLSYYYKVAQMELKVKGRMT